MIPKFQVPFLGADSARVLTGGGGPALRVRQIGSFLYTRPYGPEQKCTFRGNLGVSHQTRPHVGLWVGKLHLKGQFYTLKHQM